MPDLQSPHQPSVPLKALSATAFVARILSAIGDPSLDWQYGMYYAKSGAIQIWTSMGWTFVSVNGVDVPLVHRWRIWRALRARQRADIAALISSSKVA